MSSIRIRLQLRQRIYLLGITPIVLPFLVRSSCVSITFPTRLSQHWSRITLRWCCSTVFTLYYLYIRDSQQSSFFKPISSEKRLHFFKSLVRPNCSVGAFLQKWTVTSTRLAFATCTARPCSRQLIIPVYIIGLYNMVWKQYQ